MIKKYLPSYDFEMRYYPAEQFTDKNVRFLSSEIIREKVLLLYNEEIPHGVAVQITAFDESEEVIKISADIYCEKESHKGIIIGKKGETLKRIGTYAREDLERFFGVKVYINLWVKVKEKWRDSTFNLNNLGYSIKDLK